MCGGAILSDIIPPPRRATGGNVWRADKKRRARADAAAGRPRRVPDEEVEEEFEADFEGFVEAEEHGDSDGEAKPLPARTSGFSGDAEKKIFDATLIREA